MASGWYLPTRHTFVWDIPSEGRAPKSPIANHLRYVMFLDVKIIPNQNVSPDNT